jgi:hypothetical protein
VVSVEEKAWQKTMSGEAQEALGIEDETVENQRDLKEVRQ